MHEENNTNHTRNKRPFPISKYELWARNVKFYWMKQISTYISIAKNVYKVACSCSVSSETLSDIFIIIKKLAQQIVLSLLSIEASGLAHSQYCPLGWGFPMHIEINFATQQKNGNIKLAMWQN